MSERSIIRLAANAKQAVACHNVDRPQPYDQHIDIIFAMCFRLLISIIIRPRLAGLRHCGHLCVIGDNDYH
jgi:hypothetical protein